MHEVSCSSATEFLKRLRITDDLWGGQPAWDWGFRGQGDIDNWKLLPSAFRPGVRLSYGDDSIIGPLADRATQCWREYKLIQQFLFLADRVGLSVPGDAQHFRLPPVSDEDRLWQTDWPQQHVLETLAIAQHHGVPTRLLDITHNSFIAAFFAADDARDAKKVAGATRFGVWAVDLSLVRQAAWLRSDKGQRARLIHVTAPRAGNSFLHNQDGLFLLDTEADQRRVGLGHFQPMDEVVEEVWREVEEEPLENLRVYRRCPASPCVAITAPIEVAMDVLDLLDRDFFNRARIMPTHDNVVKSLEFQRLLNAHRLEHHRNAAVTFTSKYPYLRV